MAKNCIIFPHIPKCGGTSLKAQIENSELETYFDYDRPPRDIAGHDPACDRRNREAALLDFGAFDLVFGHFPVHRYEREHYRYITLLRDPLERAASHYFYWKNVLPTSNTAAIASSPVIRDIKDGKLGFVEFVRTLKMDRFYQMYLGDKRPEAFLLVGFVDQYEAFLMRLNAHLPLQTDASMHLRKGQQETLSKAEQQQAGIVLKKERQLIDRFRSYWA